VEQLVCGVQASVLEAPDNSGALLAMALVELAAMVVYTVVTVGEWPVSGVIGPVMACHDSTTGLMGLPLVSNKGGTAGMLV